MSYNYNNNSIKNILKDNNKREIENIFFVRLTSILFNKLIPTTTPINDERNKSNINCQLN